VYQNVTIFEKFILTIQITKIFNATLYRCVEPFFQVSLVMGPPEKDITYWSCGSKDAAKRLTEYCFFSLSVAGRIPIQPVDFKEAFC
jgi:hypothetical protein